MTVSTIPPVTPLLKFFDNNGAPLAYGKLFTYQTATSTKQATYTDSTGNTPNTNPIILNARGEASVWLDSSLVYKLVLATSTDTDPPASPIWTQDPIGAFNITQITGSFTTVTASSFVQAANIVVTGTGVPSNGIYLPAANRLGFATGTTARGYIDSNGQWVLAAPTASVPTMVIPALGVNTTNTLQFPTAGSMVNFARSTDGALNGFVGSRAGTSSYSIYNSGGTTTEFEAASGNANIYTNAVLRGTVNNTGAWTLSSATVGNTFTVSNLSGVYAVGATAGAAVAANLGIAGNGTTLGTGDLLIQHSATSAAQILNRSNASLSIGTNGNLYFVMAATGAVSISVPTAGDTLTVAPSVGTGALMATSSALTSGAGAGAGTITNAPSAGNPTKWIKINDNGVIRAIPAW